VAGYFGDDGRRAEQGHHMVDIARERERCQEGRRYQTIRKIRKNSQIFKRDVISDYQSHVFCWKLSFSAS